jgi:hypothetical protein
MSHFSFTRGTYDECATQKQIQQSQSPFTYTTDPTIKESQMSCFAATSPLQHNPFKSIPAKHIDIESDLRLQTRPLTKCPEHKFNPNSAKKYQTEFEECKEPILLPEYTRVNKPCNVLSGISINRFQPLCDDPQSIDKIHSNTYIGTNTRLLIKDAYKNNN